MIKNKWQDCKEIGWRPREDGFEGCRFYWCNKKYIGHAPFLRYSKKSVKKLDFKHLESTLYFFDNTEN